MEALRVCFIGDSSLAGVGDPEHLGWTGRLAAGSWRAGRPLTACNLRVWRQTSRDSSHRWLSECPQRHDQRIEHLDGLFRTGCREAAVPYVSVFDPLLGGEAWRGAVRRSDGAHPAAGGYHQLAELVRPIWTEETSAAPEQQGVDGG